MQRREHQSSMIKRINESAQLRRSGMLRINAERLIRGLLDLRAFGSQSSGVVRPAFSQADMQARYWLREQFEQAGLISRIDGVGNVLGFSPHPGKALLIGSHADSQPTGGWLDGAMGVIYALEIARSLAESDSYRHLPVDIVALQDEESRFVGCLGAKSLTGVLDDHIAQLATDKDGIRLVDALEDAGLSEVPRERLDHKRYIGFLEAHIEQGPTLEVNSKRIGIVTEIVGVRGFRAVFRGQQNHAGTTMMALRRDASTALYAFANRINQVFAAHTAERSVWTMGRAKLVPNATSIIPGYAELDLQFRDASESQLERFTALAYETAEEIAKSSLVGVELIEARSPVAPSKMSESLYAYLERSAQQHVPNAWIHMPSGAFHDAGVMADFMPSAMLFIPSIGGISHDFAEDSHRDDLILGCQVMATAVVDLLASREGMLES